MSVRLAWELQHVRTHYIPRSLEVDGVAWTYLCGGTGSETLLLLPGGPGRAETSFHSIAAFEQRYRILAPDYPSTVRTVRALVDGLIAILKVEQIEQVHVIGGSYSGLIAQCLLRRTNPLPGTLILTDTGLPRRKRAARHRLYRAGIALMPMVLLRMVLWLGAYMYVREIDTGYGFWRDYMQSLARSLSKGDLLSRFDVWIDFDLNYSFEGDRSIQSRPILIIETDHDPLFRSAERAALRALYPLATTHRFDDSGHAASLARTDEYIAVIEAFLSEQVPEAGMVNNGFGKHQDGHGTTP